jgi:hypothetical protein
MIEILTTPRKVPAQDLLMDFEKWGDTSARLFPETGLAGSRGVL